MKLPEGRALTPAQKSKMIESIFQSWLKCPELRLGQLIVGALRASDTTPIPLFYVEDQVLEDAIVAFADKLEKLEKA
jgi:hypothetical protein